MRTILPKNPKLVPENAKRVFEGVIYDVYHWEQKMFDGSTKTFEMLKRPDSIKVVAVKDNKIVITKQTQPNSKEFYDIPGGMHDEPEEDELTGAKRELVEETGLVCKNWKLVSVNQPNAKIEQFLYIFLAWDVIDEKEQKLDSGEKISIELIELENFKNSLRNNRLRSPRMDWLDDINSIEELIAVQEYK